MRIKKIFLLIFFTFIVGSTFQNKDITIFLAGDSTIAEKLLEKRPETGWGEKIGIFFSENIKIKNHAKNGRSTKSFINEGRWQAIMDSVSKGDYVFIQFGHNDQSITKGERYTHPIDFKNNYRKFVIETRSRDAIPVLITPVMRRRFNENGTFYDVHGIYPDLIRQVAKEMNVALIDLSKSSEDLFIKLGEKETEKIFLILKPGDSPNYPEGKDDNTHFNDHGAEVIAKLVADDIKKSNLDLRHYFNKLEN
ncbi:MAG: rhamnogalacturonan acetylesterase [Ignavibacteriales bacterium]|nr:rhamnogalacturonan acetylesterase [Ignavibacteriales bacterium]MCB9259840.1 rhamnogalacturonan acetylesterase [Ignavibacteriales bacterium]